MFTKNQYYMVWQMAVQESKKLNRKIFGANQEEKKTMDYKLNKDKAAQWEEVRDAAAKAFINYEENETPSDGD